MAINDQMDPPKNYDEYPQRFEYAMLSLNAIEHYLKDFKVILDKFLENNKEAAYAANHLGTIKEE
jgi:hypothetical protein